MHLTLSAIADHVKGRLEGEAGLWARGYSIDSRTIQPGELFFAIQGPRFDGHGFVADAVRAGAVGAVVSNASTVAGTGVALIHVGSTTEALQALARGVRRVWGGSVIGVTGSVGKTTTKEMVARVLASRFSVLKSMANLNNEYGLPLSVLSVEPHHEIAVLEMGMSAPGEIRKLATIAEPNEGVITNVSAVHAEFFDSIEDIAAEKADLLKGLVGNRRAYLNQDDARVRGMDEGFEGEVIRYGACSGASFGVESVESRGLDGVRFKVRHQTGLFDFELPLLGVHNVSNALAAISVGATHGVEWPEIQTAVGEVRPAKRRGQVYRLAKGSALIDDSYNSNPAALTRMVQLLGGLRRFTRRILVAGEMLELGDRSRELHRACGRAAFEAGVDQIIAVQGQAASILEGAREAGQDPAHLYFVEDARGAVDCLTDQGIGAGEVILVKGSRGVGLDQTVDIVRARFEPPEL